MSTNNFHLPHRLQKAPSTKKTQISTTQSFISSKSQHWHRHVVSRAAPITPQQKTVLLQLHKTSSYSNSRVSKIHNIINLLLHFFKNKTNVYFDRFTFHRPHYKSYHVTFLLHARASPRWSRRAFPSFNTEPADGGAVCGRYWNYEPSNFLV